MHDCAPIDGQPATWYANMDAAEARPVHHECPTCGYRVTNTEFMYALYDFRCPRCGLRHLSEYVQVRA